MNIEHEINTDYIDRIKEIIIKNPYGCSIENDVETITTYDPVFNLKMPSISKYFVSETVTIKGYLSGGEKFTLELPIDSKKQIKMTIDESEIINEEIKEEVGEMLSAKDAAFKTMEVISRHKTAELQKIDNLIEKAIQKGERRCSYEGIISGVSKEELKRLGYEVTIGSQYNQGYVIIKW